MSKKKAESVDKRAIAKELMHLKIERTRVIGDMFSLHDATDTYCALEKRLDDLNVSIAQIMKDLKRLEVTV